MSAARAIGKRAYDHEAGRRPIGLGAAIPEVIEAVTDDVRRRDCVPFSNLEARANGVSA